MHAFWECVYVEDGEICAIADDRMYTSLLKHTSFISQATKLPPSSYFLFRQRVICAQSFATRCLCFQMRKRAL